MQCFHADTSILVVNHHYTLQHGEIIYRQWKKKLLQDIINMLKFMFNVFSEGT